MLFSWKGNQMGRELFQLVKESVTARQAAEAYGLKVNRSGMCCCPFHGDLNPSMKLDERYYCFGCGVTGDAIDLTAKLFGINTKAAAEKVAADFGIVLSNGPPGKDRKGIKPMIRENPEMVLQKKIRKVMDTLIRYGRLMETWKKEFAPQREDEEWEPLFTEALQNSARVEFLLDEVFSVCRGQEQHFLDEHGGEIDRIERRLELFGRTDAAEDRRSPRESDKERERRHRPGNTELCERS